MVLGFKVQYLSSLIFVGRQLNLHLTFNMKSYLLYYAGFLYRICSFKDHTLLLSS